MGEWIPNKPGQRIVGRAKGTPNKSTALLKDAILKAADLAGGKDGLIGYLLKQAKANPGQFMVLLGKVLPLTVAGDPDKPIGLRVENGNPLEFIEGELARIAARERTTPDPGRLN